MIPGPAGLPAPVRTGEFGPFDVLSDWAHALYAEGQCGDALLACAHALTVVDAAGDRQTARYLRYITCLAYEMTGQWSKLRQRSEELLERLGPDSGPYWRAKVLGLLSHALIQQGSPGPALDALAEAYGLIVDHPGDAYNRGSACQAVSSPLHSALLFDPAVQLLRTARGIRGYGDVGRMFAGVEEAMVLGTWGLFLELLGDERAADARYVDCASAAVRAQELARRVGDPTRQLQAASLLQFAYQRLRSDPVDRALMQRHADAGVGRDGLLPRLALASLQAREGDVAAAGEITAAVRADARRLGEPVPAWVAAAWLAELEEHRRGSTEATRRWRALAVSTLERLWRDREGRFDHLVARLRVNELTERVRAEGDRLWEDALTSVGNRRLLDDLMAVPEAAARPVAFVDVDRFKSVNDGYGHGIGDEVLRRIAVLLRAVCRAGDAVIRYGGDEFVVVLAEDGDVGVLARRIRASVARFSWDDIAPGLQVTVTVGTSPGGPGALAAADADLIAAKTGDR